MPDDANMIGRFREIYGNSGAVRVFRAPGRVNLIGEHTDYNMGFVLPVALQLATYVAAAPSPDGKLRIYSEDKRELREWPIPELGAITRARHWSDYPIGVIRELMRAGSDIGPANLLIRSTVPEGSGLSSSAALEVSSALAFLRGRSIDGLELARLCQRAEVNFVQMPCGIMDQYVSVFGRENRAVEIDCRSLQHRYAELPGGIAFVAVNTMVKHALSGSAYKDRVRECAAAVEQIRRRFPRVESLRDLSAAEFQEVESSLPDVIARRARHVVTENARVERFVKACADSDLETMGRLLVNSHRSLQHDYEVSCPELDFLVDAALELDGVYGARMTGGGFGGCIVAMLRAGSLENFAARIVPAYRTRFRIQPAIYPCRPSEGAGEVKDFGQLPAS